MKKWPLHLIAMLVLCTPLVAAERLTSPDGQVAVQVEVGDGIAYSVLLQGEILLADMPLSLTLSKDIDLGKSARLIGVDRREVSRQLKPVVRVKNAVIDDTFNEMTLRFRGQYCLVFRAYDDAVAYRWVTSLPGRIRVMAEEVTYRFVADVAVYFPEEESFQTHSERLYMLLPIGDITSEQFASLPLLVDIPQGPKVAITESDLSDYPGLYLQGTGGRALTGRFPAVASREKQPRDRDVVVTERADHIAETEGSRSFPWRVLMIAPQDKDLLTNEVVYKLAGPCELEDTDWIKPGKIPWDWWNANNLFGVDFAAGVNTKTYEYFIDFAAEHHLEYVIFDEGWYQLGDLLAISPDMDMEALFAYAKQRNVGLILWVVWKTLEDQLDEALNQFEKWGAAGLKVDFMQRDDQWMVNYYERIARAAAEHKLLIDFHGSYSPKGLRRRYPNVMTREGVKGLEHHKWSDLITPEHNVTLPFTRMVAGPMDYTPGAMDNAQGKNFAVRFSRPMSQGTRCHQLAMYVIYESPLQMLADSPSRLRQEPECMEFLSAVPSVWDQSIALDARVADYVLMARRSGSDWYVGAMTDGSARELAVDLSFLGAGTYLAHIYRDGPNAERYGNDYARRTEPVTAKDTLTIKLAPGGGWVARIEGARLEVSK